MFQTSIVQPQVAAGEELQIQFNVDNTFSASDRLTFDAWFSVQGLPNNIVVPELLVNLEEQVEGGEYQNGSSVSIRFYPFVFGASEYLFDPDNFIEFTDVESTIDENFAIVFSIDLNGADGWVVVRNINGDGWFGIRGASEDESFSDFGDEYFLISDGTVLDLFQRIYQTGARISGNLILDGATSGGGGKVVFKSAGSTNANTIGNSISFEMPPPVLGIGSAVNHIYRLPSSPAAANTVLVPQSGYSGSGDWITNLVWTDFASIGNGVFLRLDAPNIAFAFGQQVFKNTVPSSNGTNDVLILTTTVGTLLPGIGHGAGLQFRSKNGSGNEVNTSRFVSSYKNAIAANLEVRLKLSTFSGFGLEGNGLNLSNSLGTTSTYFGLNGLEIVGKNVTVFATLPTDVPFTARGATSQSANLFNFENVAGTVLAAVLQTGAIKPASMVDANAANDSIYFSTTQNKLCYKDALGVVNQLY